MTAQVRAAGVAMLEAAEIRRRRRGAGRSRPPSAAVRPPARAVRGAPLGSGGGALAGRGDPRIRRGWRVVRGTAVAGHRQRLRDVALQRRHRVSSWRRPTAYAPPSPAVPRPSSSRPVRLDAIQTVHAMTVHRAQGSQFDSVSFVVPPPDSPLLTRELLYTAVTRARRHVLLIGSEEAIRRAIQRPANRASGLRNRLAARGPDILRGLTKRKLGRDGCPPLGRALNAQSSPEYVKPVLQSHESAVRRQHSTTRAIVQHCHRELIARCFDRYPYSRQHWHIWQRWSGPRHRESRRRPQYRGGTGL